MESTFAARKGSLHRSKKGVWRRVKGQPQQLEGEQRSMCSGSWREDSRAVPSILTFEVQFAVQSACLHLPSPWIVQPCMLTGCATSAVGALLRSCVSHIHIASTQ